MKTSASAAAARRSHESDARASPRNPGAVFEPETLTDIATVTATGAPSEGEGRSAAEALKESPSVDSRQLRCVVRHATELSNLRCYTFGF